MGGRGGCTGHRQRTRQNLKPAAFGASSCAAGHGMHQGQCSRRHPAPHPPPVRAVQVGDIQLLHNWTNLHTRTEYEDYEVCGGGAGGGAGAP